MPAERLQKIIAAAGIASRRKAEQLIAGGAVSVNGKTVTELGAKADPATDRIKVNGQPIKSEQRLLYLVMNKPKEYVTTVSDPEGRPTVMDIIGNIGVRVYPVGRLDYHSEGLLLFTNDGALAHQLTRAATHVPKTYLVKVSGPPTPEQIDQLRRGVMIFEEDRRVKTAPAQIKLMRRAQNPWFEVTLVEGRNRQIRKMFEAVGHHVEKIKRVKYGPLELDVEAGRFRSLTNPEVQKLKAAAEGKLPTARARPKRRRMRSRKKNF